ncbi:bromodomain-containing protein DDB_G0270170-like isoform X2 [Trifolium pratense]|uniref:bromodomain-containing protein DDB_G0270170-like isoform X2 n=1 Tax=Trifolium pratense TaxID=57577 RepID=UPI001E694EED|nr:bromodomain-containing protein DDB_G0270170-like isoform X2 [Trifolium pratense]
MVQIAKRKKGRPSKADLARRSAESQAAATESDSRRSLRRKNVRYNIIDYDGDYIDDEEDERRREKKKLKLMAKLQQVEGEEEQQELEDHATMEEEEECDEIEGGEENEDAEEKHEEDSVIKGTKVESKGLHFVSVSANYQYGIPLPDRKILEVILDKLQKKDTYGVFAEPVDPEELPDYHEVIEHPMDFATVRKKLANAAYPTLEQFESDIFLICSNAMKYNSPETVYHRQARTIQELGRKKFEKLRIKFERTRVELNSELKTRSNSLVKKSLKKLPGCASQESVGFDLSYGDVQPTSYPMQSGSYERHGNIDGIVTGNAFLIDANQDKAEDVFSGKNMLSKIGKKSSLLEDNRRSSYNMSNQPITRSDSTFMTFESGTRQLVTVGVHAEYSYTRSLARFSASLGPIVWKIASSRIQQALPADCKFGRGWVGEYEALPNPILMLSNHLQKETGLIMKLHGDKNGKDVEAKTEHPVNGRMLEQKHSSDCPTSWPASEGNPSIGSAGMNPNTPLNIPNQQNAQSRNFGKSKNNSLNKVELKSLPSSNQNNSSLVAKFASNTPIAESKHQEMAPRNLNTLPATTFKQPDTNEVGSGELPDRNVMNTSLNRRSTGSSSDIASNQAIRTGPFVFHGQEQGLTDPVQSTRMFTEEAQKTQTSSNPSPVDTLPEMPSAPSGQRDASGNASAAAAQAWMSAGAGGFKLGPENTASSKNQVSADPLHNSTREFHQHISRIQGEFPSGGMSVQSNKNNFPFNSPRPQPIHTSSVSQFPNRPMGFPQSTSADHPRFQMQSPWRGLSPQSQPRQKQQTLPPDLNIDCHSPGSPAKQSSGVVDSQQPDLALQL